MSHVILPDNVHRWNRRLWVAVAGMTGLDAAWLFHAGISVDFSKAVAFFIVLACCMGISAVYRFARRDDHLFFLGQITAQLLLAILSMGIVSYLGQRLGRSLVDDALIAADHALGFDWQAHLAWVDAHPYIAALFRAAYFTSGPQVMLIVAMLFVCKQVAHIQRYIAAFILTAAITIALASLFPAMGGFVHYDVDIMGLSHFHPAAGRIHEAPLLALRSGEMRALVFPLQGIITFPSFHSALSVLLVYASWPVTWLRRLALPLNALVILSTPANGGHWLCDVIGGVVISLVVIALVARWMPREQTTQAA